MFTVKQVTENGEKLWTDITCVDISSEKLASDAPGVINSVQALGGPIGLMTFRAGPKEQTIYVMNDNGSTVAKYRLHDKRANSSAGPLPEVEAA